MGGASRRLNAEDTRHQRTNNHDSEDPPPAYETLNIKPKPKKFGLQRRPAPQEDGPSAAGPSAKGLGKRRALPAGGEDEGGPSTKSLGKRKAPPAGEEGLSARKRKPAPADPRKDLPVAPADPRRPLPAAPADPRRPLPAVDPLRPLPAAPADARKSLPNERGAKQPRAQASGQLRSEPNQSDTDGPSTSPCERCLRLGQPDLCHRFKGARFSCTECHRLKTKCIWPEPPSDEISDGEVEIVSTKAKSKAATSVRRRAAGPRKYSSSPYFQANIIYLNRIRPLASL